LAVYGQTEPKDLRLLLNSAVSDYFPLADKNEAAGAGVAAVVAVEKVEGGDRV
jgi:hypothetical protein